MLIFIIAAPTIGLIFHLRYSFNFHLPLRYEYKYYVPIQKVPLLRSMLQPFTQLDPFAAKRPDKQYTVRSIYFDTPDFASYTTKEDGFPHRNKVRLRGYNEEHADNTVFLEIKRKYEIPIHKNRAPLAFEDVKKLFKGEGVDRYVQNSPRYPQAEDNARRFFYQIYTRKMRPVVTVVYEREPYLNKFHNKDNDLRITLDKNLRSVPYPTIDDLYKEERVQYPLRDCIILEVKFNHYCPAWVKPIIGTLGVAKEPASKYVMCIDIQKGIINVDDPYFTHSSGRFFRY